MEPPDATATQDRSAAARLRGAGPLGWLSFLVIFAGSLVTALVGALLVLGWAALSATPWRDLGFVRPRRWWLTLVGGVVSGVAFKLAMKSVVMPLLGAPALNQAFGYLAGNSAAFHQLVLAILVGAGFGEEVLYRGYLFERLGRLLGRGRAATLATVIVTSLLFAAAHYTSQGMPGVQQALVTGLVFGGLYARTRALPLVMTVHAAFDLAAAYLIYHRLEATVAHWFFR
jgi:membrane protease YdiL (CAAX protease family)